MAKESKKGRNKRHPAQNTAYKTENRRLKNKKRKLLRHIDKLGNDKQAVGALKIIAG